MGSGWGDVYVTHDKNLHCIEVPAPCIGEWLLQKRDQNRANTVRGMLAESTPNPTDTMLSTLFAALAFSYGADAQTIASRPTGSTGLEGSPYGFGLGAEIGSAVAISGIWKERDRRYAIQGAVGSDYRYSQLHFTTDYIITLTEITSTDFPDISFDISGGGGIRVRSEEGFGVRFPGVFTIVPERLRMDIFILLAPVIKILPYADWDMDGQVGLRFYL